jgi:hypothetical protein
MTPTAARCGEAPGNPLPQADEHATAADPGTGPLFQAVAAAPA